ncbi:MAG: AAA family ATPase [Lachnospiraceae bacterium]|nr:AAA family ATPase [Lachnospiraceae bacterium]
MNGILPIKKYNSESALNNFDEFTMTNPAMLSEYVGFTEKEVQSLCRTYHMNFEEAARWYDGYSFRTIQHIYSPNSVVKSMLRGEYSNYWTSTVAYESLRSYIVMNFDGLKDAIVQMLTGERCKVDIATFENDLTSFECRDDVLTILIHLGYLAYDYGKKEAYVPNEEMMEAFCRAIKGTGWTSVIEAVNCTGIL